MAASGVKKVSVEVDAVVLAKLDSAAHALSGLAGSYIHGCDDLPVHPPRSERALKASVKRAR